MSRRVAVYTLRIMGPDFDRPYADVATLRAAQKEFDTRNKAIAGQVNQVVGEAEELINLTLPDGYYAKIDDA